MDCSKAEELFFPYLLGALDSPEREQMDTHLESCHDCSLRLQGDGETMARLAFAVPQLEVPAYVKQRLFSRIEAGFRPSVVEQAASGLKRLLGVAEHAVFAQTARAVASVLLLGLIFGGVWFNARLNHISHENEELAERIEVVSEENQDLSGRLEEVTQREADVMDMVKSQRYLTYEALRLSGTSGTSVNMLWGTGWSAQARGMVVASHTGTEALLLALNLPPLPSDKVYQVWLIKDGQRYNGGLFTVDSTGFGQTVIIPYASIAEFEAIRITIEPAGGSKDPTGTSVLNGDL